MSLEYISKKQKQILFFVNNYVKKNKNKINTSNSAVCYFHSYGNYISSSYLKLRFYGLKFLLSFFINLCKNFYSTIKVEDYICVNNKNEKIFKYFVISHVSKGDFTSNGHYIDKYFSINSKIIKSFIFLNSTDSFIPKNYKKIL